ncbi:MAG TPA: preprotein translocase subunit YajC [Enteractinococcus helveticum]|uniref:Preprotein translocase subunit YajC n=1 Tax=Enteractinococcus helveticum TaxID=1837282 RepID=A0A921FQ20_9MICC|nr:preprotein translocase subunit YajC [Enteractinococcus helveticum]HJF15644.1 preprotein translocase subunit YajC [Enteractinococcus helveticum]
MTHNAEFATVIAQAEGGQEGGSSMFMLLMLAVLGLLFFMMIRRSRKAMKTQQEQRASMQPGMQIMTTFGLYGTIIEVDRDDNKAVIELSPGHFATVHLQAIGQVVEEPNAEELPESDITVDDIPDYPEQSSPDSPDTEYGSEYKDPRDDRDR